MSHFRSFGSEIVFRFPKGFRGPAVIIEDPQAEALVFSDSIYEADFPSSGVIRVKSVVPFSLFHNEKVYVGDQLVMKGGISAPEADISFFHLTAIARQR